MLPTESLLFSPSFFSSSFRDGDCRLTGTSTSFSTSTAVLKLSGSSYSAKPNLHALSSASVARIQRRKFPAVIRIRSISSSVTPAVIPQTKIVRRISSFVGGCNSTSRAVGLWSKDEPRPAFARSVVRAWLSDAVDLGPVVPRRMTGARKLIFGMFGGG